ncbi:MAG: NADPH-dependent glutamate synthase [Dehalococcoidales bacterium]|nr:NADPH-dependent glutamate synthase [Dehalococcoidales bacterium]
MPKLNLNVVPMPEQDPMIRAHNFDEVALGYSLEEAYAEAKRCLQCKNSPCISGCPVEVDIPAFVRILAAEGDPAEAARVIKAKNNLPAICGRVCPQESQCQSVCLMNKKGAPLQIGRLERFAADWGLTHGEEAPTVPPSTGHRVAIVGAGPASITAAADLARMGHEATMFEALHGPGGVLMYGIPPFRLPRKVLEAEVKYVQDMGVEIRYDWIIGRTATLDDLLAEGYEAIFLGTGAGLPQFLGIPGENLSGVYSANEFLTRSNLMHAYEFPEYDTPIKVGQRVGVVGSGNVAMDASRTALRLGADKVYVIYRRSRAEMPARAEEIHHAEQEGIEFRLLTNPVRVLDDGKGRVAGVECMEMELGEPDASGRRRPVPKEGSNFVIDLDILIIAIGTTPNPLIVQTTEGLEVGRHGTLVVNPDTLATTKPGIWAGGDAVTGAATVITAMGAGKKAAKSIDEYLRNGAK